MEPGTRDAQNTDTSILLPPLQPEPQAREQKQEHSLAVADLDKTASNGTPSMSTGTGASTSDGTQETNASTSPSENTSGSSSQDTQNTQETHDAANNENNNNNEAAEAEDPLADIFGSSNSPIHTLSELPTEDPTSRQHGRHANELHPSSSPRLRAIHSTAGYRDGVSAARETAVQGGFDEGYLVGAAVGARVGVLMGVVKGIVSAVAKKGDGTDDGGGKDEGRADVRERVERLYDAMCVDLRLENVLGPDFVLSDGSWGWEVDEADVEKHGVHAVAEAHPLIKRYAGIVGTWMKFLNLRRVE